ncbi:MAG: hypothetical protein ACLUI3_08095 [Christensenellales bacterium]
MIAARRRATRADDGGIFARPEWAQVRLITRYFAAGRADFGGWRLLLAAVSLLGETGRTFAAGWRALPIRWAAMLGGTIAVLLLGVWGSGFSEASFIYFNF